MPIVTECLGSPAGTILISMYGTIGLTKVAAMEMGANQALCALIPPLTCSPDYLYHHLNVAYSAGKYSIYGGVRNLFDKGAPLLSSPIEGNTDQNTYDVIGRYVFAGVSMKF